jgi:hypothetical protein
VKYKQLSADVVMRCSDWVQVPLDDPDFLAWLEEGNSPFAPDDVQPPPTE